MSRSRRVAFASKAVPTSVLRVCAAGAIAVAVAGCAAKQAAEAPPQRVSGPVASADDRYWRVEIEEDGLPAQLSPKVRRPTADDPSEPWSPNYGSKPGKAEPAAPQARAAGVGAPAAPAFEPIPPRPAAPTPAGGPVPPAAPVPTAARTAVFDEEALIRRAIAEHEMRRRD